jgi:hypothetical protein
MFYDITIERYLTYEFKLEADNQAEAERLGRELMAAYDPATDDVTVQAKAMVGV